jgi:tripartite-type tricarboxylate transporter receptor subunit TctC
MLNFHRAALAVACVLAPVAGALAQQDFPTHPLRLVVPFAAGGAMDVSARIVAKEMAGILKQAVVVENRDGAAGILGAEYVAKAPADGYTLCWCQTGTLVITPLSDPTVPYKPLKDLIPVSHVLNLENVLIVRKDLPVNNFQDLVALGRKTGSPLTFGTPGAGGTHHLGGEWMAMETGMKMLHVPYKGENPAVTAVMAGQIDMALSSLALARPLVKEGRVKIVANLGNSRSKLMPELATVAEQGFPNYGWFNFMGVNAPAGTPPAVVDKLSRAIAEGLKSPEAQSKLTDMGMGLVGSTPAAYGKFLEQETAKWGKLVQAAGLTRN